LASCAIEEDSSISLEVTTLTMETAPEKVSLILVSLQYV